MSDYRYRDAGIINMKRGNIINAGVKYYSFRTEDRTSV
jgi:hypothetical protein